MQATRKLASRNRPVKSTVYVFVSGIDHVGQPHVPGHAAVRTTDVPPADAATGDNA